MQVAIFNGQTSVFPAIELEGLILYILSILSARYRAGLPFLYTLYHEFYCIDTLKTQHILSSLFILFLNLRILCKEYT